MSEASANQSKNETTGGRATEASERDRRAAAVEAEMRADERAAAGWGGAKNTGRTQWQGCWRPCSRRRQAHVLCQAHKNEQVEDERARQGGRADETEGLVCRRERCAHRRGTTPPGAGLLGRGRAVWLLLRCLEKGGTL